MHPIASESLGQQNNMCISAWVYQHTCICAIKRNAPNNAKIIWYQLYYTSSHADHLLELTTVKIVITKCIKTTSNTFLDSIATIILQIRVQSFKLMYICQYTHNMIAHGYDYIILIFQYHYSGLSVGRWDKSGHTLIFNGVIAISSSLQKPLTEFRIECSIVRLFDGC